jgi:hypothetical protein
MHRARKRAASLFVEMVVPCRGGRGLILGRRSLTGTLDPKGDLL